MPTQQIWTHGNAGMMEVPGAPRINTKQEIDKALYLFAENSFIVTGGRDMVDIGGWGTAAFIPMGFEGRVVVWDRGKGDNDKSGGFWLQYALPTIVTPEARIREVMVRSRTNRDQNIRIARVHVWDANRERVYADDRVADASNYEGRINKPYEMGLSVSLFVRAQRANDDILRIFSVGAEIEI